MACPSQQLSNGRWAILRDVLPLQIRFIEPLRGPKVSPQISWPIAVSTLFTKLMMRQPAISNERDTAIQSGAAANIA